MLAKEVDQLASERENQQENVEPNEVAYEVEVEAIEHANEDLNEANESVEHQLNALLLIEDSGKKPISTSNRIFLH